MSSRKEAPLSRGCCPGLQAAETGTEVRSERSWHPNETVKNRGDSLDMSLHALSSSSLILRRACQRNKPYGKSIERDGSRFVWLLARESREHPRVYARELPGICSSRLAAPFLHYGVATPCFLTATFLSPPRLLTRKPPHTLHGFIPAQGSISWETPHAEELWYPTRVHNRPGHALFGWSDFNQ